MSASKDMLVSIIIPTYNAAAHLEACLQSIRRQTYKNIEIIVVDQESIDSTKAVALKFATKVITLPKPDFYTPPTRSRNSGARVSEGEILYHLDSDMDLSPALVEEIVDIFSGDAHLGALIVHEEDRTSGFWSKAKAFERRCYWGNDKIESARAVRRSVFERVGGYDEHISSGEDFDIHRRYKEVTNIGFCQNVVIHNLGTLSLSRTLTKKFNYGKTADLYFRKHSVTGFSILREQLICYARHYPALFRHPVLGAASLLLKIAEFGSGTLGLLAHKATRRSA